MRKVFFLILILLFFGTNTTNLSAQQNNEVTSQPINTKVGNPAGAEPTGECETGGVDQVMCWIQVIKPKIEQSQWVEADGKRYYNKILTTQTNGRYTTPIRNASTRDGATSPNGIYWCTNIVIDAYTLAGVSGLSIEAGDQSVAIMTSHWNSGNLKFYRSNGLNIREIASIIKPGFAMMQNGAHVGIVKEIHVDPATGNGVISTIDANSPATDLRFPVSNWQVQNLWGGLSGFGGIQ